MGCSSLRCRDFGTSSKNSLACLAALLLYGLRFVVVEKKPRGICVDGFLFIVGPGRKLELWGILGIARAVASGDNYILKSS